MSEQTHQTQQEHGTEKTWRVITLIGDKYDQDIDDRIRNLPLAILLSGLEAGETLCSSPDLRTNSHFLDHCLAAPDKRLAVAKSITTILSYLEVIDILDPSIRFSRIGPATNAKCEEALDAMFDVTDLAVASEGEMYQFSSEIIAADFEK